MYYRGGREDDLRRSAAMDLWIYGIRDVNVWAGIGVTYYVLLHERQRNIILVHVTHTNPWP